MMVARILLNLLLYSLVGGFPFVVEAMQNVRETDIDTCCPRKPNTTVAGPGCTPTILLANVFQDAIETPGFPSSFPPDIFCTWEIHAQPGKRIWLDFRNLHLIKKEEGECHSQKLIVRSPLTGLSMGPFCGHDGLPNIVSTGNHLVVELQSPYPTNNKEYKGFQIVYMETVQSTSTELRPPNWSNGMFVESKVNLFRPKTPPSRFIPRKKTTTTTTTASTRQTTKKQKTQSPHPKTSPPKLTYSRRGQARPDWNIHKPYVPPRTYDLIPHVGSKSEENSLGTEVIVGIVMGGIVLVAVISVVVAKITFSRSEKRKKKEAEEENQNVAITVQKGPAIYSISEELSPENLRRKSHSKKYSRVFEENERKTISHRGRGYTLRKGEADFQKSDRMMISQGENRAKVEQRNEGMRELSRNGRKENKKEGRRKVKIDEKERIRRHRKERDERSRPGRHADVKEKHRKRKRRHGDRGNQRKKT